MTNEATIGPLSVVSRRRFDVGCQRLGLSDGSGERDEEVFEEGFSVKDCESIQQVARKCGSPERSGCGN